MAKKIRKKTEKLNFSNLFPPYLKIGNYLMLFAGVLTLIVGFYLMTLGEWNDPISLTIAPIIVLIGFIIVIPLGIFYKFKSKEIKDNATGQSNG